MTDSNSKAGVAVREESENTSSELTLDDLWGVFREDPGKTSFLELANRLHQAGDNPAALDVLFRGLSHNPSYHLARLSLARIFFEQRYLPFALRELEELAQYLPKNQSIQKLLKKFGRDKPQSSVKQQPDLKAAPDSDNLAKSEEVMAEAEFDFDQIDLLEEDEG